MILLVDDDPTSLRLLEMTLRREGHRVTSCRSPREALRQLVGGPRVDLVIADINMPEMSGLAFIAEIRSNPDLRGTPVMMCSSASDPATVRGAIDAGARDYIVKPIVPDVVVAKVDGVLAASDRVVEPRLRTMERLRLTEPQYRMLAMTTLARLDELRPELRLAIAQSRLDDVARIAGRAAEPAAIFHARCFLDALDACRAGADANRLVASQRLADELALFRATLARLSRRSA